jgi:spore germination protein GerM
VGTGFVSRRVVGVVAGVLILVAVGTSACGIPTNGTPTAIAKTDVPFHLLSPVTSTTVHPVVRAPVTVPATIYLVEHAQHVYAVSRNIPIPATLSEILGALLEGPTAAESELGLQSFLSGTTTRVRATVSGGIATVDFFSANPVQVVGPDQTLAIAQMVFTATEQPGVTGVVFKIDNRAIDVPTASGAEVPGPVKRSSYQPQAPLP